MTEEEKEAIEYIKELIKPPLREEWDFAYKLDKTTAKQFKILVNYIDKLQKRITFLREEIYGLNKKTKKLQKENDNLKIDYQILQDDLKGHNIIYTDTPEFEENYIHKAKIKEALGDKNIPNEMILTYIETLVSENNRLEDIEDRKVQIEYNNVFNKGVKSVENKYFGLEKAYRKLQAFYEKDYVKKDKIRNKIKELEEPDFSEYPIEKTIEILKKLLGDDEA